MGVREPPSRGRWGCAVSVQRAEGGRAVSSTTARGYGYRHQRLRAWWAPRVATGLAKCWRCGRIICSDEPWHLGHADGDKRTYRGPEHVLCNCRTNARDRRADPRPRVDRFWEDESQ